MNHQIASIMLFLLGTMAMAGDLFSLPTLKALGIASGASPAPKVFSAVDGLETFSSTFEIQWLDQNNAVRSFKLTSEANSGILGPYNRRNVYGAALAYGPVLVKSEYTRPMFEAVSNYAFCDKAPMLKELGISQNSELRKLTIKVIPKPTKSAVSGLPSPSPFEYEVICNE